ncbi:MAG: hypothetical protein ABIN35_00035 [candidate division WOR-3 bacterium]
MHNNLNSTLISIFNVKNWSNEQYLCFKLLKQYVDTYQEKNRQYGTKDDINIIEHNFNNQIWFKYSKSKPIISHLMRSMRLESYVFNQNQYCINFHLVLSFENFILIGCLYQNFNNKYINSYICCENKTHQKGYLTYYTKHRDSVSKTVKVPDFTKIYQIIKIDQSIFYQSDLLSFLAEIVIYYDDSETIGNLPIANHLNVSLNQIIQKYSDYLLQQKS